MERGRQKNVLCPWFPGWQQEEPPRPGQWEPGQGRGPGVRDHPGVLAGALQKPTLRCRWLILR